MSLVWLMLRKESHKEHMIKVHWLTWNFGSMFTLHHVSYFTCQVPGVRCQVSGVTSHLSDVTCIFFFFQTNWQSLMVDGLLSMGPPPSSLQATMVSNAIIEIIILKTKRQKKNHATITVFSLWIVSVLLVFERSKFRL